MRIQECKGTNISWISQIFIAKIAQNAASFRAKRYIGSPETLNWFIQRVSAICPKHF